MGLFDNVRNMVSNLPKLEDLVQLNTTQPQGNKPAEAAPAKKADGYQEGGQVGKSETSWIPPKITEYFKENVADQVTPEQKVDRTGEINTRTDVDALAFGTGLMDMMTNMLKGVDVEDPAHIQPDSRIADVAIAMGLIGEGAAPSVGEADLIDGINAYLDNKGKIS